MLPARALIINPWVTDFKLYDEWMHPLGLYALISLLKHNRFNVTYHDCLRRSKPKRYGTAAFEHLIITKPDLYRPIFRRYKRYGETIAEFEAFLRGSPEPDVIFVGSGMTYWLPGLVDTVSAVQGVFPRIPVIVGGTAARLMPQAVSRAVPGVHVFTGSLLDGDLRTEIPFLREVSTQGWTNTLTHALGIQDRLPHGPIVMSLGCPLACSYCASRLLHGAFAARDPHVVINEIAYLVTTRGVTDLAFSDDALLHEPERHFLPLVESIMKLGAPVRLHAPNGLHVRGLTPEVAAAFKRANFVTLRFGYETGDPQHRADTGGKITRPLLEEKLEVLRNAGFSLVDIGVYVMAGLPGQDPNTVINEIAYVSSLGVKPKPVFLSPVPGTPLFNRYTGEYPDLLTNPLWHNDSFFVSQLPGWGVEEMERVIQYARGAARDPFLQLSGIAVGTKERLSNRQMDEIIYE